MLLDKWWYQTNSQHYTSKTGTVTQLLRNSRTIPYTQIFPPFLSGFITSMPAEGTRAFEQLLHDLVYVKLEQAMVGQSACPRESCTSPVRLSVTGPQ